jgi:hypothetical protein
MFSICLCWLAWLAIERPSHGATDRRVVLLQPNTDDELTALALARIRGELLAAGFEVTILPQPEDLAPRNLVEATAPEWKPLAVFAIIRDKTRRGAPSIAEIWVSDRVLDRTSVERMRVDGAEPEHAAAVLAVRAVELLKAGLTEFWLAPEAPPLPRPVANSLARETPPANARRHLLNDGIVAQGAFGLLHTFGQIGPIWTPMLAVSYGAPSGLGARWSIAGLGSDARLESGQGTARLAQSFATMEMLLSSRWRGPFQLFASAGAGAYHMSVGGTGVLPYRGREGGGWSLLTGGGVGLAIELNPHVVLVVEGQTFWAWPSSIVRIGDTDIGKQNWPILLGKIGPGISL